MPKLFPEDIIRDGGQGQKNVGSPIDTLVNTVSHMQRDLAILRDENRALRTPDPSQVIQVPDGRHSQRRKCHSSTELLTISPSV